VTIILPVHVDSQRLAIHGGVAVFPEGPPAWPPVEEDILNVFRAIWSDRAAGAWGDAGVISFGASKLLTAGRGGAVLTYDAQVRHRIRIFSQRGKEAFPLNEMQAAVLLHHPVLLQGPEAVDRVALAIEKVLSAMNKD
jgi:hypothetical protein